MFLIKRIYFEPLKNNPIVENGIRIGKITNSKHMLSSDMFCGNVFVHMGEFADFSKFPQLDNNDYLLSYVSEYEVTDIRDGFKKFDFNVSTYQEEKIEGYLIFIQYATDIKTNGTKLFSRYCSEIVAELKEGEYLEFNGRKIEVINNHLMLHI